MRSKYLSNLNETQKKELRNELWKIQSHKCFICEKDIDLVVHKDNVDFDHIIPLSLKGLDKPENFALTHSPCNRSKQAKDLRVARILAKFSEISENLPREKHMGPNLKDIFQEFQGSQHKLGYEIDGNTIKYSFSEIGSTDIQMSQIYDDKLSKFKYFFGVIPIEYLYHDERINPRSIGRNISKLIQEFIIERPQLHVSLGYILTDKNPVKIKIFDGQHKAAAQVLLGTTFLPLRVFIDPDLDILLTTNTNAGTSLRQVAFDKSVQRHLGSELYAERVARYQREHNLIEDDYNFSEEDLVKYFRGESREMKKFILDSVKNNITHNIDNKLRDFIEFGGRAKTKPFSYSAIDKTFYSTLISNKVLKVPLNYRIDEGLYPRVLEKEQIIRLMNIIAEEIFIGKFDSDLGVRRIENQIQSGKLIPEDHLIAFRISKEEIVHNWLKFIQQIIFGNFTTQGKQIDMENLFQYKFSDPLFEAIRIFIRNLKNLPIWVNKSLSNTIFGGKRNYDFWKHVFETGRTIDGVPVLTNPIRWIDMISEE